MLCEIFWMIDYHVVVRLHFCCCYKGLSPPCVLTVKQAKFGLCRCEELQVHIQPEGDVQATREASCQSADEVPTGRQVAVRYHQSAYRVFFSTETVIARVLSDIYTALDSGNIAALALLDLSAAFDTVDHRILLHRLQKSFGLSGSALAWFMSYLSQHQQYVSHRGKHSETTNI